MKSPHHVYKKRETHNIIAYVKRLSKSQLKFIKYKIQCQDIFRGGLDRLIRNKERELFKSSFEQLPILLFH